MAHLGSNNSVSVSMELSSIQSTFLFSGFPGGWMPGRIPSRIPSSRMRKPEAALSDGSKGLTCSQASQLLPPLLHICLVLGTAFGGLITLLLYWEGRSPVKAGSAGVRLYKPQQIPKPHSSDCTQVMFLQMLIPLFMANYCTVLILWFCDSS